MRRSRRSTADAAAADADAADADAAGSRGCSAADSIGTPADDARAIMVLAIVAPAGPRQGPPAFAGHILAHGGADYP